jgi:biopolymer transport protein ExbD
MTKANLLNNKSPSQGKRVPIATRPFKLWQDLSHSPGEVQINILPLMDVIFCILTFFILGAVGLSRQQAISLDLPKATSGTPQMREMLVVSLDDFGQLYVEQQVVTPDQLQSAIKNYHQYNPTGLMVLHAARNASYNEVVQVLDMLRSVGGDRVALATLPGDSTPNTNYNSLPSASTIPGSSYYNYGQPQIPANGTQGVNDPLLNQSSPLLPGVPTAPSTNSQTTN